MLINPEFVIFALLRFVLMIFVKILLGLVRFVNKTFVELRVLVIVEFVIISLEHFRVEMLAFVIKEFVIELFVKFRVDILELVKREFVIELFVKFRVDMLAFVINRLEPEIKVACKFVKRALPLTSNKNDGDVVLIPIFPPVV